MAARDSRGARALLGGPAVALGLGHIALGFGGRRSGMAFCLTLGGCLTPQDPADLPFRTSSILRHENGRMKRALLVEETEIDGFPCRSFVWWYEDGSLDNVELTRALRPFEQAGLGRSRDPDGGTGLGLAIVYRLAEMHGASFSISSAPNRGTTVRIGFSAGHSSTH